MDSNGNIRHLAEDDKRFTKLIEESTGQEKLVSKETGETFDALPAIGGYVQLAGYSRWFTVHGYRKNKIVLKGMPREFKP